MKLQINHRCILMQKTMNLEISNIRALPDVIDSKIGSA